MRYVIAMLISFILSETSVFSQENKSESLCAPDSPYDLLHKQNISDLRISLLIISEVSKGKEGREIEPFLENIADASAFSLANVLSLRADFIQNCTKKPCDYYAEIAANEKFMLLLHQSG